MWYMVIGRDNADSLARRATVREQHLARVQALCDQGRVLTAGPLPAIDSPDPGPAGFIGSLMVVEFPDLGQATTWAQQDPYLEAGAWTEVEVHPYKEVLP